MAAKKTDLATRAPVAMGERGVKLTSLDEAYRFAKYVAASDLSPKGMGRPEQVLVALQVGAELGLSAMHALSSVTVINGRASLMGAAARAVVRRSGALKPGTGFDVKYHGKGDDYGCTVTAQRADETGARSATFTVRDAKRARLWGKSGPWSEYPDRMLMWRATSFLMRDHFSDVLMGLPLAEEDYAPAPETPSPPTLTLPVADVEATDSGSFVDPLLADAEAASDEAPEEPEETPEPETVPEPEPSEIAATPPRISPGEGDPREAAGGAEREGEGEPPPPPAPTKRKRRPAPGIDALMEMAQNAGIPPSQSEPAIRKAKTASARYALADYFSQLMPPEKKQPTLADDEEIPF